MSFHVKFQRPQADVSNPTRQRAFELSFWRGAGLGMQRPPRTLRAGQGAKHGRQPTHAPELLLEPNSNS
eukprot:scaffold108769_cov99-Phaeocystis_antarctica.AAC.1